MNIGIVTDTSADFTSEEREALDFVYVPFTIEAGGESYLDDETLDQDALYADMKATKDPIRTACPSPFHYKEAILKTGAEEIFVVTISSKLSGSYNAAQSAAQAMRSEYPGKKITVIDSKSASAGVSNVVDTLRGFTRAGDDFETAGKKILEYIERQITFFILESMDNLIKNGRIPRLAGKAVNVLNVKPIMRSEDGAIALHQVNRGFKKSLRRLGDDLIKICKNRGADLITISHSSAEDKAQMLKEKIEEEIENVRIRIVQTKGLASAYADFGGIVVAL